jgi:hypothetical protein
MEFGTPHEKEQWPKQYRPLLPLSIILKIMTGQKAQIHDKNFFTPDPYWGRF